MARHHRTLSLVLLVVGLVAAGVATVSGYVRSELLDSDHFGDRAVEVVRSEPVRVAIATAFADEAIGRQPRLLSARPAIISAAEQVLGSRSAGGVISRSAGQLHRTVVLEDQPSVILDLADLSVVVRAYLNATGQELPERLRESTNLTAEVDTSDVDRSAFRIARQADAVALVSPIVALLCLAGILWLAPDRRRALWDVGAGFVVVAGVLATAFVVVRGLVVQTADGSEVARAVFDALLGDLLWWIALLGAAGTVLAAAAASLIEPAHARAVPREAWDRLRREPQTRGPRVLRGLGGVALGLLIVAFPSGALVLAASAAGAYLVVLGLIALLDALLGASARRSDATAEARLPKIPIGVAALALAVPFIAALIVGATASPSVVSAVVHGDPRACNGSIDLCDRRVDQIVFPSSHNAMGNAAAGFLNANHALSVTDQLDLGIRGMQIDALAGQRNDRGFVRTDLTGETEDTVVAKVGPEALAAAQRLAGRIAFGPIAGDTDLYLCHVLCELGATLAVDEFSDIRGWLDRHPREVLLLFIQDEASREMIVEGLEDGGLADLAATFRLGQPFPTLGEMIRSGKRVAIFAEREAGPPAWYMDGFQFFQETPFSTTSLAQLEAPESCRANRGTPTAPLFQLNHWVESYPPNPVRADTANAPSFILARARRCMERRDRVPNILAVDFAERGDIVGAAQTLNDELIASGR